ncbi:fimbrillin family protein [Prevotella copri]|uniref:Fimbrillin family protein n=1 Tax=Segatella copri TaxID=165179 RepID=A0A6A7VS79_9BACT|nr:fimbrillin family protein [Segatella copri]MQM58406.1 fimbrillin family protein [Segatella copri]MQN06534.1 fimbrillin family protein [Segatella copri]MQN08458.1 fimbrillin family protein [Segatella copri]MQO60167.1 fimbrillin family protein [Segatella copri]MQO63674.1 fimbrillin family protein [Segatella copri]
MKRNIYSKLWVIFFVLMGAACTNQVEDAIPVSGQPIGFSVQSDWKEIHNSRSNDKTQFIGGDEIQIFGFHKPSKDAVENVQFMYQEGDPTTGQKVTYDNGNWNYSPKRFWPKKGVLDFFASYPYNSVHYDVGNKRMTYNNNLTQDLLYGLATNRDCASKRLVEIWMVHALAKVKIILDKSSLGNIGTVKVSGYKAGHFYYTIDGVPAWEIDDVNTHIDATFHKFAGEGYEKDEELFNENSVTVFILPKNITGLQMWDYDHHLIDASEKIKNLEFEAGKVYNLTISKSNGVRKKNTNSRSIAMSVRCVSE